MGTGNARLLNLGNPQASHWLTEHIDNLLTEEGIDLYRQDFAGGFKHYWEPEDRKNPDRQGMTELRHVIAYLKYLDELQRRHPEMLIDICAAGGKRLDLEHLRRAVPLWRSDHAFVPLADQGHTYGLAHWVPYFGTAANPTELYSFRSGMCLCTSISVDMRNKNLNYELIRKLVKQWREVAPNYYGDYYPLTPYSLGNDMWMGWQFHRPEVGEGMVQMFCRPGTMYDSGLCKLKGLDSEANYSVRNFDSDETMVISGKELMETGLRITFKKQPDAALIRYQRN